MKRIAITMGDPGGIGPEVVMKALPAVAGECIPLVVGDRAVLETALRKFRIPLRIRKVEEGAQVFSSPGSLWCLETGVLGTFQQGRPDKENAAACVRYIKKAVGLAMEKRVDAVVTAPISKEALTLAGFPWPGHTELLAELTGTREYAMMLIGGPLRVILVTIHTSLRSVPGLITKERVLSTIRLARRACDMLGLENPRIAVSGLNPHAGESGILGTEEREEIAPAIEGAKEERIIAEGPFPPDVVFRKAYNGELDMVVCMYHDQGLIPLKMVAFDTGVNVTVGLPIIRTSPDHGTAYDIAWKGIADASSMREAIRMAVRLRLS